MNKWLLLTGAIGAEVIGTMALRGTVDGTAWILLVVVAYVAAFWLFGIALRQGIPVGVAYGIWGASGVALIAILVFSFLTKLLAFLRLQGYC